MGSFGVIVCSKCRNATAIDLKAKANACPRCGKRHKTRAMKIFFKSTKQIEVAAAVAELNANIHTVK
jgi:uncharacterized paraquat-inducible protein A